MASSVLNGGDGGGGKTILPSDRVVKSTLHRLRVSNGGGGSGGGKTILLSDRVVKSTWHRLRVSNGGCAGGGGRCNTILPSDRVVNSTLRRQRVRKVGGLFINEIIFLGVGGRQKMGFTTYSDDETTKKRGRVRPIIKKKMTSFMNRSVLLKSTMRRRQDYG